MANMPIARIAIAEGVTLNIIQTDKFKTNLFSANLMIPLAHETASLGALLPMVLRRGTANYPTMADIAKRLQYLYAANIGARNYKRGETQIIGLYADMLTNSCVPDDTDVTAQTVSLLFDMLMHPYTEDGLLSAKYISGEQKNLIDLIHAAKNNKDRYAMLRAREEMCRGERFGISEMGDEAIVSAITPQSLTAFHQKLLASAQIELFFVGVYPAEKLTTLVREAFAGMTRVAPEPLTTEVIRSSAGVREVKEQQRITQAKLALGFRTGTILKDNDYYAFALFNEVFGGSPASKLFMQVREALSLCYYCQSIAEAHKGIMTVASAIEAKNKDIAQSAIMAQLEKMKTGEITDEEIDAAKKSLKNAYCQVTDSAADMESWYLGRILAGISDTPEQAAEHVMRLSMSDIVAAAGKVTLDTIYFLCGEED